MLRSCPAPGFTLIELLVVIAIVAVTGALVAPRMAGTLEKHKEEQQLYGFVERLYTDRRAALVQGHSLLLDSRLLSDPEAGYGEILGGWSIARSSPVLFTNRGAVSGGFLLFNAPSARQWVVRFSPLDGAVDISQATTTMLDEL